MKLYLDKQMTEDLSRFSNEELESFDIYSREYAQKQILLKGVSLDKNAKGQLVIQFNSENHKYLRCEFGIWTNQCIEDDYETCKFGAKGLRISTFGKFKDEKLGNSMRPISSLTMWLEAESEEEEKLLNGQALIVPMKWNYVIVIIPWEDIITPDDHDYSPELPCEEDTIYFYSV